MKTATHLWNYNPLWTFRIKCQNLKINSMNESGQHLLQEYKLFWTMGSHAAEINDSLESLFIAALFRKIQYIWGNLYPICSTVQKWSISLQIYVNKILFSTLCIISILFDDRMSLSSIFESLLTNSIHIFRFIYYVCVYKIWHLQANQGFWHKDFSSLWQNFLINICCMFPTMDMN